MFNRNIIQFVNANAHDVNSFIKESWEFIDKYYLTDNKKINCTLTPEIYQILNIRLSANKHNTIHELLSILKELYASYKLSDQEKFEKVNSALISAQSDLIMQRDAVNEKAFLIRPFGRGMSDKLVDVLIEIVEKFRHILTLQDKNKIDLTRLDVFSS